MLPVLKRHFAWCHYALSCRHHCHRRGRYRHLRRPNRLGHRFIFRLVDVSGQTARRHGTKQLLKIQNTSCTRALDFTWGLRNKSPDAPFKLTKASFKLPDATLKPIDVPFKLTDAEFKLTDVPFKLTDTSFKLTDTCFKQTDVCTCTKQKAIDTPPTALKFRSTKSVIFFAQPWK